MLLTMLVLVVELAWGVLVGSEVDERALEAAEEADAQYDADGFALVRILHLLLPDVFLCGGADERVCRICIL